MQDHNSKELITEVLQKAYLLSLATVDEAGPWVADLVFIHDEDLNIYWISSTETRHSRAIERNGHVAGAITANLSGEPNLGIQFDGVAEKLAGPRFDLVVKYLQKKHKPVPHIDTDILMGRSWYVVRPTNIDLIYEPLFGFTKQKYAPHRDHE